LSKLRLNVVDSCGWLEYFADGPGAGFFASAIEKTDKLVVPSICLLEVFKRALQQRGEESAIVAISAMREGRIVNLDSTIALNAARLGVSLGLPLADSVILATAQANNAIIWTSDSDFKDIDGVKFLDKRGHTRHRK